MTYQHLFTDTIAAIATAPGEGGIAIIRIGGPEAIAIADRVFSKNVTQLRSHTVHFGQILDETGEVIDEGLLIPMRAPRSYTGEDIVEIHGHGGSFIAGRILEAVTRAGARPAAPGEFTQRAFLNGKLDLAQAEAVQELIAAKNRCALKSAKEQLQGALSKKVTGMQQRLTDIAAIIEAWVDYPEEGLEFASFDEIKEALGSVLNDCVKLKESFRDGKLFKEGPSLCLIGAPNVGKSSLMNALLGKNRAIVTPIAGTTRDLLQESLRLSDLHFHLIDTAGIRETEEIIEREGIRRSLEAASDADLILMVLDVTRPLNSEEEDLIARCDSRKTLIVLNKVDLPHTRPVISNEIPQVAISAKEESGLAELKEAINAWVSRGRLSSEHDVVITQERHFQALDRCGHYLQEVLRGFDEAISPEFMAIDLKSALKELGTIVGTDVTEDILNAIFSKFCVGK